MTTHYNKGDGYFQQKTAKEILSGFYHAKKYFFRFRKKGGKFNAKRRANDFAVCKIYAPFTKSKNLDIDLVSLLVSLFVD